MLMSNKRAVSTIIAYVLLIGLAISMSVLVYNWLKLHTSPDESQTCPDSVSLSIENISCSASQYQLNLTVKNRGNFIIKDISVKVSDEGEIGTDELSLNYAVNLGIGESKEVLYSLDGLSYRVPLFIEVQPEIFEDGKIVYCSQKVSQKLSCDDIVSTEPNLNLDSN